MVSGMLALLVATSTAVGPLPQATTPAPMRYRLDVKISQSLDLTAAGQGMQEGEMTGVIFLTLTTTDSAEGLAAHAVIDSMSLAPTGYLAMQMSQEFADSLRGESIHAYIKDGRVEGTPTNSASTNPAMNVAASALNVLFPGIGAKAKGAKSFSDTLQSNVVNEQGTRNTTSTIDWTVTGSEGDVLTLTGKGSGTISADMNGQQINGTSTNSMTVVSSIFGPSRSATLDSDQDMTVLVQGLSDPIPVKVKTHAELTALP